MKTGWTASRLALASVLMGSLWLAACGAASAQKVRFATATDDDFAKIEAGEEIWFEFAAGDEIPLNFLFVGIVEGATERPVVAKAKRRFWLIQQKDRPIGFSFDGKTPVYTGAGKVGIVLGRQDGENGAGALIFIGEEDDVPEKLKGKL